MRVNGGALAAAVAVAPALLVAVLAWAPASAQDHHDGEAMLMVGNMGEYPDLAVAGKRNGRLARRLLRRSRAAAARFDTLAEARRLGYRLKPRPPFRPGFTHMRKAGTRFWGSLLDAQAPQSLLFWCPSHGTCTLAAFMYRAPGGDPPATWGDVIQWHRHGMGERDTWMMHLWLVGDPERAFATCAPFDALAADLDIAREPYRYVPHAMPCAAGAPMQDAY